MGGIISYLFGYNSYPEVPYIYLEHDWPQNRYGNCSAEFDDDEDEDLRAIRNRYGIYSAEYFRCLRSKDTHKKYYRVHVARSSMRPMSNKEHDRPQNRNGDYSARSFMRPTSNREYTVRETLQSCRNNGPMIKTRKTTSSCGSLTTTHTFQDNKKVMHTATGASLRNSSYPTTSDGKLTVRQPQSIEMLINRLKAMKASRTSLSHKTFTHGTTNTIDYDVYAGSVRAAEPIKTDWAMAEQDVPSDITVGNKKKKRKKKKKKKINRGFPGVILFYALYNCPFCPDGWESDWKGEDVTEECPNCYYLVPPMKFRLPDRCFGYYACPSCNRTWASALSWTGYGQECIDCSINVLPYRRRRLKVSEYKAKKSHQMHLCEKCKKFGRCCTES